MIDIKYCPVCSKKLVNSTISYKGTLCSDDDSCFYHSQNFRLSSQCLITKNFQFNHLRPYFFTFYYEGKVELSVRKYLQFGGGFQEFPTLPYDGASSVEDIFAALDYVNSIDISTFEQILEQSKLFI